MNNYGKSKEYPVWLVWSQTTSGNLILNAICTTQARAMGYRKIEAEKRNVIRAWVDKALVNHLFAHTMT